MEPTLPTPVRAFWWGVLHAIGMFEPEKLDPEEIYFSDSRTWFSLGEVCMAGLLAGTIAVPAGCWFAGRTELPLAFIGMAVVFLPLFVYLPRLLRYATVADTDAVLAAFGKNEQLKRVFWALFVAMAGLVLAQVVDPATAQKIVGIITGLVP
jgi:hypothetical protein